MRIGDDVIECRGSSEVSVWGVSSDHFDDGSTQAPDVARKGRRLEADDLRSHCKIAQQEQEPKEKDRKEERGLVRDVWDEKRKGEQRRTPIRSSNDM